MHTRDGHVVTEDMIEKKVGKLVDADDGELASCRSCRGTGTIIDIVPYGSTTAELKSGCECVWENAWAKVEQDIKDGELEVKDGELVEA